jgi:hypothetical protein
MTDTATDQLRQKLGIVGDLLAHDYQNRGVTGQTHLGNEWAPALQQLADQFWTIRVPHGVRRCGRGHLIRCGRGSPYSAEVLTCPVLEAAAPFGDLLTNTGTGGTRTIPVVLSGSSATSVTTNGGPGFTRCHALLEAITSDLLDRLLDLAQSGYRRRRFGIPGGDPGVFLLPISEALGETWMTPLEAALRLGGWGALLDLPQGDLLAVPVRQGLAIMSALGIPDVAWHDFVRVYHETTLVPIPPSTPP